MPPIRTLRDDFAMIYLQPLIAIDIQRQTQGFPASDIGHMVAQSYQGADLLMQLREKVYAGELGATEAAAPERSGILQ